MHPVSPSNYNSTHRINVLSFSVPVKQEPTPSSPSQAGLKLTLPATPKSSNGDRGEEGAVAEQGSADRAQGHADDDKDERMETDGGSGAQAEMEVDQTPEEKHFVLAPTPAQLGKAPLQRRLASSCSQDSSKDMSPTELPPNSASSFSGMFLAAVASSTTTTATTPMATPTPTLTTTMDEPPPSSANSTKKKQFFKKAKNDDMDT